MDFSNPPHTRPLLEESDNDEEETVDLRTQSYQESNVVVKDSKPLFRQQEPRDKYNLAYVIFYLIGMTTLLPWNFFVTADDYWMYKFRYVNRTAIIDGKRTPLQAEFTSYVSVASALPNIAFLAVNTAMTHRVSVHKRVIGSLLFMLLLFIITTVFVKINTDSYQQTFFAITLTTVALLNVASAVLSGSIFGIIGKFSPKYITATVGGQALGGIFAALAEILSLSVGISPTFSAFLYFIVGTFMILLALFAYIILSKSVFFKYHLSEKMGSHSITDIQNEPQRPRTLCHRSIFKRIWVHALSAFLVFAITLSVYPGVTVLIESENKRSGSPWTNKFFVPVVAYLLFNTGDYSGRLLAGYFQYPKRGSWIIAINLMRIVFIPLLLLCNAQPRHSHIPVLLDRDWYYVIVIILCSFSNGYLANLIAISAPPLVEHHEKETASSMITVFLGLGLGVGSSISLIIVKLI